MNEFTEKILHYHDSHQSCFWNNPFAHIDRLKELKGIVATDYSLFRDYSIAKQKWNCFKNRVIAYHWQQQGLNVIPTASWSIPDSFEWCWDGLPKNSVLGITTNGIATAKEGYRLFVLGLDELVKIGTDCSCCMWIFFYMDV